MTSRRAVFISLFAVSMGFLEAAVVVYLRLLYYPEGFVFPLIQLPLWVGVVELVREAATLIMLWSVAMLAGRTGWERFGWFSVLFGIWDIVYYLGLWLALRWPSSLLTWDILFLIPLIWVGPVLAPVLISLALIGAGYVILHHETRRTRIVLGRGDWVFLWTALGFCLYSFMANHPRVYGGGLPEQFPWVPFLIGLAIGIGVLVKVVLKNPRARVPRRYGIR